MKFRNNLNLWKQYNPLDPVSEHFQPETSEFNCAVNLALAILLGEKTAQHTRYINRFTTPTHTKEHQEIRQSWFPNITHLDLQTILQIQAGEMTRTQEQWKKRFAFGGFQGQDPLLHYLSVALDSVALEALAFLVLGNKMYMLSWYLYRDQLCSFVGSNTLNCRSILRDVKDHVLPCDWEEVTSLPVFQLAKKQIKAFWLT